MSSSTRVPSGRDRASTGLLLLAVVVGLLVAVPPRAAAAATCPCTVFTAAQTPANPSENDSDAVELGMKFRADQAGFVSGVRFYKGAGNTGSHTGSLWSSSGSRLATVTFSGETSSGWQQANFASPVAVTAGTTYVVSYYAPSGHYAADSGSFANAAVVNAPLTALQNGTDGGDGVYRYGTGGGFPNSTYQSTNYWVDVVFNPSGTDTTKPTVTDKQPAAGATGVPVTSGASATFSEAVQPATIVMTLTGASAVQASTSYDAASKVVTLTPAAALATGTTYTVNLSGAKDTAGNTMDPLSWTFTTAASATGCPCTIWSSTTTPATAASTDSSAVEVGVKFRSNQAGYITGLRFYKGSGNTGTHVGSLWTRTGARLASVTFSGESTTGWQSATFGSPVPVAAGTTYVASYYAPVGRYPTSGSYFASSATTRGPLTALATGTDGADGVYLYGSGGFPTNSYQATNYWVDVVFSTTANDTVAPSVVSRTPAAASSGASTTAPVVAGFSEPVVAGSVGMVLKDAGGGTVAGTVAYDASSQSASFTPSAALATSSRYTVTVSGAKDAANNVMSPDSWSFTTAAPPPPPPDQGPGGPIAVVTSSGNPYSKYLAEILRTEGLNEFATIDVGTLSASTLAGYDVVVLGNVSVTAGQAADLTSWVNAGGNLIAMRPGPALSGLLGITAAAGSLSDAYLKVDPATAGAGIVSDTMQFHGTADRYTLSGATAVATLYSNATTATTNPAVTLRDVGSAGGQAAAFTFDLPRSVALTRQGNPAWVGTERDGQTPVRADDMFFGGSTSDWVDFSKVAIPQADEQQRLLTNLIQVMNRDKKPLPRFWYFPQRGSSSGAPSLLKAVLVGTGDDHGNNGTAGRFDQFLANSPAGCSVADWTCYRYSSYLYPSTPLSDAAAKTYSDQGFEIGVHESTGCSDYTAASVAGVYANDISNFRSNFPSLPNAVSTRMHCLVFSDWASQPKVETGYGIRTDTNYYYWPGSWVQDRPGFMTGSGMPMRFTDTDGTMIDDYQAPTQMTDESGQTFPYTIDTLLDNAQGSTGYYGAFVANFHTDQATEPQSDALLSSAQAHNVPIISGRQLSTWLDGRNGSSYGNVAWSGNTLSFSVSVGSGATGLTGMLPTAGPNGTQLTGISRGGVALAYATSTVKGLDYAAFNAASGSYTATYGAGPPLRVTTAARARAAQVAPTRASDLVPARASARTTTTSTATTDQTASIRWRTSRAATSRVLVGTSPDDLEPAVTEGGTTSRHAVAVTGLEPRTRYYYRVASTDTTGKEVVSPAASAAPLSFTTAATDVTAPSASAPVVTPLPDGTATISWTTDVPTAAGIRVGDNATKTVDRKVTTELTTQHSFVLTDLQPGRTYVISTVSQDLAGNRVVSKAVRYITPALGVAQQTAQSFRLGTARGDLVIADADPDGITLEGSTLATRSGTFVSGVLDAHEMVDWDRATVSAQISRGSTGSVSVRLGSTVVPDGTWTDWTTVPANRRVRGSSRYLQYRVQMSAPAGVAAPVLFSIGFSHNGAPLQLESETGG